MKTILYKTRTNPKGEDSIQVWKIEVTKNVLLIHWGVKNGKMQIKKQVYDEGKQKRSPAQQALFEAESLVKKKMKQGYATSEQLQKSQGECIQNSPLPMLAHTFSNDIMMKKNINTIALQPKLDGIRCLANLRTGELWSRKQTRITGLTHIEDELRNSNLDSDVWLDGELYTHNMSFNDICSRVRRTAHFDESKALEIQYWVYDTVMRSEFQERHSFIAQYLASKKFKYVKEVKTLFQNYDFEILKKCHDQYVKDNYEGLIVRNIHDVSYDTGKRSKNLLKYKSFKQEEFVITGCILRKNTNPNKPEEILGSFELFDSKTKKKFQGSYAGTEEEKRNIWINQDQYIGQIATVKFFEYTPAGIPRFPVVLGFRHPHDM